MSHFHAVVWVDHAEAHVIHFNREGSEELVLHSKHRQGHLHHKRGTIGSGHAPEDQDFFHHIVDALAGSKEILVVGPANAKNELVKHMQRHDKAIADCVVAVETVDHPTDGQLLKLARKYFKAADRMLP